MTDLYNNSPADHPSITALQSDALPVLYEGLVVVAGIIARLRRQGRAEDAAVWEVTLLGQWQAIRAEKHRMVTT